MGEWIMASVIQGALCLLWVRARADNASMTVLSAIHLHGWMSVYRRPFGALHATQWAAVCHAWPSPGGAS